MVPSLPGYGFSSAPGRPGFGAAEIASTLNSLMLALGYDHYVAQGVSAHNLHAVVFPQSNWPVADWPWLVAYIRPHFVHKFTKYAKVSCPALAVNKRVTPATAVVGAFMFWHALCIMS